MSNQNMPEPKIALMVAMAQNNCIGKDNTLPWHLPEDLKHFKRTTMGKPVVMGRKTFDSIGRPLPGRPNIVITRNSDWQHDGVTVVANLQEALERASVLAGELGAEEVMIMGGAQIYTEALPMVERMYLTQVHADVEGDAFFPKFDRANWDMVKSESYSADDRNPYSYSFECWQRRR